MHIALFGGTFDPPHNGHEVVAQEMIARQIVDEVWFVPVNNHPFQKMVSSMEDRLAMLEMLIAGQDHFQIETYELSQSGPSYSFQTLTALSRHYPQHTFSWLIGSDNLEKFNQWHAYQELLNQFHVYVYPRYGFPSAPLLPGMIFLEDFPEIRVSGTEIRQKLKNGESIHDDVCLEIEKYISDHDLY